MALAGTSSEEPHGPSGAWQHLTLDILEQVMSQLLASGADVRFLRLACKFWSGALDRTITALTLAGVPPNVSFLALFASLQRITLSNKTSAWSDSPAAACAALMHVLAKLPNLRHLDMYWHGEGCLDAVGAITNLTTLKVHRELGGDAAMPAGDTAATPASLAALQHLHDLHLRNITPDYAVLRSCTSLQHLELEGQAISSNARTWRTTNTLAGIGASLSTQLTALVARGNYGISRLPADMSSLTNLRHLDLSRNMLWQLPGWLSCLQRLTHLNVSANCLSELPEEVGQLALLQELDCSTNSRLRIPGSVSKLGQLRRLSANWIWSSVHVVLEAAQQLSSLQELSLVGNGMTELPEGVGQLSALTHLNLSMNTLVALPAALGGCSALQQLELSDNRLEALPPQLCGLASLRSLAVRSNGLAALPQDIGRLTALSYLDVSMNKLAALPASMSGLVSLVQLAVSINPLVALPAGLGALPHLAMLEMYYVQVQPAAQLVELRRALPRLFIFGATGGGGSQRDRLLSITGLLDEQQQQQQQQQEEQEGEEEQGSSGELLLMLQDEQGAVVVPAKQQQQQQLEEEEDAGGSSASDMSVQLQDDLARYRGGTSAAAAAGGGGKRGRRATHYGDSDEEMDDVDSGRSDQR